MRGNGCGLSAPLREEEVRSRCRRRGGEDGRNLRPRFLGVRPGLLRPGNCHDGRRWEPCVNAALSPHTPSALDVDESRLAMLSSASRLRSAGCRCRAVVVVTAQKSHAPRHPPARRYPSGYPVVGASTPVDRGGALAGRVDRGALADRKASATGSGITTTARASRTTRRTTHDPPSRTNTTARAFTTPDPTSAVRTTPTSSPDPPPAARVASTAHPRALHLLTRYPSSAALDPAAAAPPPAHPLPPG
jgi:hypothetical protein